MEARTSNHISLPAIISDALEFLRHKVASLLNPRREAERQNRLHLDEIRAQINDCLNDTSLPMKRREQIGRDMCARFRVLDEFKNDEDGLWQSLFWWGGLGFYSWCRAGCPDERLDAYLAAAAAQEERTQQGEQA